MIGVVDVEEMAHKLEDIFGAVKKGSMALTPEIFDSMFKALDTMRKLVHEAVTGEPSGIADFGLGILDLKEEKKEQIIEVSDEKFQIPNSKIQN